MVNGSIGKFGLALLGTASSNIGNAFMLSSKFMGRFVHAIIRLRTHGFGSVRYRHAAKSPRVQSASSQV